ncbi:hypothetical protein [Demequina zhanjiangensis]|uniref:Yip1 domain-containing protein n=1 Tax=Demequina zhanjiangensis TaxID=3051659 RepID=A0ABT8FYZ8_9MICO|nr:hypothetical protein [Demequina sp. SYSU T00b26]MDN4472115.1 hypothetical protein [Demequina sp. SYSU T00b26]
MAAVPTDASGRAPGARDGLLTRALLSGEVTFVLASALLVPVMSWAASATYPDGSAAMVGGISLVVGIIYALIGALIAVPVLTRLLARRLSHRAQGWSSGTNALAHAGIAAAVALPLPLFGWVMQTVQNGGMDLPSDLFVIGVFAAPAIVGAALAPTVDRWAARDAGRGSRLVILGVAALVLVLVAVVALTLAF